MSDGCDAGGADMRAQGPGGKSRPADLALGRAIRRVAALLGMTLPLAPIAAHAQ